MDVSQKDDRSGLFSDNYDDDFFKDGAGNDLISNNQPSPDKNSMKTPIGNLT